MARNTKDSDESKLAKGVRILDADQKAKVVRRQAARQRPGGALRPDDIGVVRIEFTVPASRLFGQGSLVAAGGASGPDVINDGDPNDDISVADTDMPPGPWDPGYTLPWPPGSEPED
jgi:hypothetical protein